MPTLYLATNRVSLTSSGHLQIVRERDPDAQGNVTFEEIEVQVNAGVPTFGQWTFFGPNRNHLTNTPNATVDNSNDLVENSDYGFIEIDIPEAEIDYVWDIL